MTAFSEMGTGFLMMLLMNCAQSIMWLVDNFTLLGKGLNLIMVLGKINLFQYQDDGSGRPSRLIPQAGVLTGKGRPVLLHSIKTKSSHL